MAYIAQPDLVQNMTPEQRILVAGFYTKFDIGSGLAHKKILKVENLLYEGLTAGSEFTVYAATKLYLNLNMRFSHNDNSNSFLPGKVVFYDETGGNPLYTGWLNAPEYTSAIPEVDYIINPFEINNSWFSNIEVVNYTYVKFIGYRITLT